MISFLLPTNRIISHPDIVFATIQSIVDTHTGENFEILIFSQDALNNSFKNTRVIKENNRQGPVFGFNRLAKEAQGDILICMTDENIISESCVPYIDMINNLGISGLKLSETCTIPQNGQVLGDRPLNKDVSLIPTLRWPVVSNKFLSDKLSGYIFHPTFFYHACDIYLAYYLSQIQIEVSESVSCITTPTNLKDSSFEMDDCNKARILIENFDLNNGYLQNYEN